MSSADMWMHDPMFWLLFSFYGTLACLGCLLIRGSESASGDRT